MLRKLVGNETRHKLTDAARTERYSTLDNNNMTRPGKLQCSKTLLTYGNYGSKANTCPSVVTHGGSACRKLRQENYY